MDKDSEALKNESPGQKVFGVFFFSVLSPCYINNSEICLTFK